MFRFGLEQRLQCAECSKVRYRVKESDVLSVPVPPREKPVQVGAMETEEKTEEARYEDVDLHECLQALMGVDALENACPSCGTKVVARKYCLELLPAVEDRFQLTVLCRQTRLATLPDALVVHARKFQLVNWVAEKLGMSSTLSRGARMAR